MARLDDYPETMRHSCDRDGCFLRTRSPNWGVLADVFDRGCRPADVDGCVEIGGYFLWMEYKGPGGRITAGFDRMRGALLATNGELGRNTHVFLVISGEDDKLLAKISRGAGLATPQRGTVTASWFGAHRTRHYSDLAAGLRRICAEWQAWVNSGGEGEPWKRHEGE